MDAISTVLPSGAYLQVSDGVYSVLTKRTGKMDVEITFAVAASNAGNYSGARPQRAGT